MPKHCQTLEVLENIKRSVDVLGVVEMQGRTIKVSVMMSNVEYQALLYEDVGSAGADADADGVGVV